METTYKRSKGLRKDRVAAGKVIPRRATVIADGKDISSIKNPNRWPTQEQLDQYHEMNQTKQPRGGSRKKAPPELFFPLLEQAIGDGEPHKMASVRRLLLASALEIQPVKRYPTWILKRTYKLNNRVLDLS